MLANRCYDQLTVPIQVAANASSMLQQGWWSPVTEYVWALIPFLPPFRPSLPPLTSLLPCHGCVGVRVVEIRINSAPSYFS